MFCSNCGYPLPDDAGFCRRCGARVEGDRRPDAPSTAPRRRRWIGLLAALAVVAALGGVAAVILLTGDDGPANGAASTRAAEIVEPAEAPESVPPGAVAAVSGVGDGVVSAEEFESALEDVEPASGSAASRRERALNEVLVPIWIRGESVERGIEITDSEIEAEGQKTLERNFEDVREFERFVRKEGFCTEAELELGDPLECAGVRAELELMLQAESIQDQLGKDEEAIARFERRFERKWRARTLCAEPYITSRCSNGPEPPDGQVPPGGAPLGGSR